MKGWMDGWMVVWINVEWVVGKVGRIIECKAELDKYKIYINKIMDIG